MPRDDAKISAPRRGQIRTHEVHDAREGHEGMFTIRAWNPALESDLLPNRVRSGVRRDQEGDDMTTMSLTDNDVRVRQEVRRQLDWDPDVDSGAIGVIVKNGVITLTGFIDSYAAKLAAERAAKRVHGVRAVANDIHVRLGLGRTDEDIARDAARALELRIGVPESVQAVVHDGHVTLTGKVSWIAQRKNAEKAVSHIGGVRGVFNHIEVTPDRTYKDVRKRIVEALHRPADVHARHISVGIDGDAAVLTGTVATWSEREAAERAAGDAPGIRWVDNRIVVEPGDRPDDVAEMC
jgi:osmotically-inducible protein OsmY